MQIAYITYENTGKYVSASTADEEDGILLNFLQQKGFPVKEEKWTDEQTDWSVYTHAILKSPWDYFDKYQQWTTWLDKMEAFGIRLLNPISIVRWNSDKHYLLDIEKAGLSITATRFIAKNTTPNLNQYFEIFATEELVVKPVVSGGSKNTIRFNQAHSSETTALLHQLLKEEDFMIQPFIKEIANEGEWSFIFFNGKYSHSLLKKAKSGDFRVQHYLGGTIHPQQPDDIKISDAQEYVQLFAKNCLYARVDGVYIKQQFHLMELELIEPFLFLFTHQQQGLENYANALKELLAT